MIDKDRRLLSIEETQDMLRVGRGTVWKLIKEEGLPTVKIGKRRLIPVKALDEWIEARTKSNEQESDE